VVEGPGIVGGQAERPAKITIIAKDSHGQPRTTGGDDFKVIVEGVSKPADVVDNGDGTYDVTYKVSEPGNYNVLVLLDDSHHVGQSPYSVYIKPAPSAKNSYAEGPGLTNPFDNAPATFTIHAVDPTGKPRLDGGDEFEVIIQAPSGEEPITATVVDNGDGTYDVSYSPQTAGDYVVDVRVGGESVRDTPLTVRVREGTDGALSGFGSFTLTVISRDKKGTPKTFGGDPFEVKVKGPGEVEIRAVDNGDGTYTAAYVIEGNGRFSVGVVLNGKEVSGSPFVQNVGSVKKDKSGHAHVQESIGRVNY